MGVRGIDRWEWGWGGGVLRLKTEFPRPAPCGNSESVRHFTGGRSTVEQGDRKERKTETKSEEDEINVPLTLNVFRDKGS